MKLNSEQKGMARWAGLAAVFSAVFLVVGYLWFPFELGSFEGSAARHVFALKADLFVFLWLVAAVGRVANIRFSFPEDIQGGGLTKPSKVIKVPLSLLQNTQEQALLAVGAHLAPASLLESTEPHDGGPIIACARSWSLRQPPSLQRSCIHVHCSGYRKIFSSKNRVTCSMIRRTSASSGRSESAKIGS